MTTWYNDKDFSGYVCQVVKNNIPAGSVLDVKFIPDQEEAVISWPEGVAPLTWEQVLEQVDVIKTQKAALLYRSQRVDEYPPIGDQLDALWKGGDAAAEMLARVQAVKNKYPKGE